MGKDVGEPIVGKDDVGEPIVVEDAQKKQTYGTRKNKQKSNFRMMLRTIQSI